MTVFDQREKAFETLFSQQQDMEFKILVRRDKLFGLWAAERAGLSGESAKSFAKSVIDTEIDSHSVMHKVAADLIAMGHQVDETELKGKLMELHELAREQIYEEAGES